MPRLIKKRLSNNENISLVEFMYPILQGYDSVKLEADIELGGVDQIFNLLVGRDLQKDFGQPQQVVITMPLLEDTDGTQKMSKSFGNYISINESPKDMFGKIMSIPDALMFKYFELLTDEDLSAVKGMHPREAKLKLSQDIVSQYHGPQAAIKERDAFERVFSQKEVPEDIAVYKLADDKNVIELLIGN